MEAWIFLQNLEMGMKRNFLNFSSLIWELKLRVQSLIRNFSFHWTIKFLHKIEEKFLRKDTGKQFNKINK